jgi:hypothetical protein
MSIKTQGTKLYAVDPADESLIEVGCVTSIDGIDTTNEQIETTCLDDTARTYVAGLATPGNATFGINFDPDDPTHIRMHNLKKAGTILEWVVGFSDGTIDPEIDSGGTWDLSGTRSWIRFQGFMTSYPFSFAENAVVQSTVGIQISGDPDLLPKAST